MALIDRARTAWQILTNERGGEWLWPFVNSGGHTYPLQLNQSYPTSPQEEPDGTFVSYVQSAYKGDGIVFACINARANLFAQARFQWQRTRGGNLGELFGTDDLAILERPWPNGTTGDLLAESLVHADLGGNSFHMRRGPNIYCARPDWVTIVLGSRNNPAVDYKDVEAEVIGYVYYPGGRGAGGDPEVYLPEEVAHFAPVKDPLLKARGMSWLTPIVREIMGDKAATDHKLKFFENAATPNLMVKSENIKDLVSFDQWVDKLEEKHRGVTNAYRTMYLAAGMDAKALGSDMVQMDFKATQGAGETRIAAAAGVPPVIAGFSEGLAGSSLNTGNYGAARRRFSDLTVWPLWGNFAGSMESIVPAPSGARLWVDAKGIPFLRDDATDRAAIQAQQASTMRQLIDAGFEPDSITAAVVGEDWKLLKHTGLPSVQLQEAAQTTAPTNGKTTIPAEPAPRRP